MKRPIAEILKECKSEYKNDFKNYLVNDCECEEKTEEEVIDWLENDFRDEGLLNIMARESTDVYNGALLDWYGQNMEAVTICQDNIGEPGNMEIMNQISIAQTYWHEEQISEAVSELIEILEEGR